MRLPRFRSSGGRDWLQRCEGFRVESPEGEVGFVEEVRFAAGDEEPRELAVRSRGVGSRHLSVIPAEEVRRIVPGEKRILVRGRGVPLRPRLLASAAFAASAASFLFPFLTATVDERRAEATGIDLVTGTPSLTGTYVHASYVGHAETLVDLGRFPAIAVFAAAAAGALLAWLPTRTALRGGIAATVAGLAGWGALWAATTPGPSLLASADHRYGFWLAGGLLLVAGGWSVRCLRRAYA